MDSTTGSVAVGTERDKWGRGTPSAEDEVLCSEEGVNIGTVSEEIGMEGEVLIGRVALAAVDEVTGPTEVRAEPDKTGRR